MGRLYRKMEDGKSNLTKRQQVFREMLTDLASLNLSYLNLEPKEKTRKILWIFTEDNPLIYQNYGRLYKSYGFPKLSEEGDTIYAEIRILENNFLLYLRQIRGRNRTMAKIITSDSNLRNQYPELIWRYSDFWKAFNNPKKFR